MKNIKKLEFSELEGALEVLSESQKAAIKAGNGVITSGSGTQSDPYVIKATYVFDQSSLDNQNYTALNDAASDFNSLGGSSGGGLNVNGTYYNFDIQVTTASSFQDAKQISDGLVGSPLTGGNLRQYGTVISKEALGVDENGKPIYGNAGYTDIGIDADEVNSTYSQGMSGQGDIPPISKADFLKKTYEHEILHNLGGNHGDSGGTMNNFTGQWNSGTNSWNSFTAPADINQTSAAEALSRIIQNGGPEHEHEGESGIIFK